MKLSLLYDLTHAKKKSLEKKHQNAKTLAIDIWDM